MTSARMHVAGVRVAALGLALGLTAGPLAAQLGPTARALGAGGAYTAVARGYDALFFNPANLALADNPRWSLLLPQFTFGATVAGWDVQDFADFSDAATLSDSRRAELLNKLPAQGTEGELEVRVPVIALQMGRFAAGVSASVSGRHTVGKGIADLIINGYDESRTNYSVGDTRGSSAALVDAVVGYGRRVGPVSAGVAGHYYKGVGLARSRMFEPTYDVSNLDIAVDYVGVNSNDGTGYGVDFGVAMQATRVLTLSASLQNAFSKMTWKEELDYRQVTLNKNTINDPEQILKDFEDSEKPFDPSSVPLNVITTAQGLFDEAVFPSVMRVGAMFAPTRRTRFAAAYHQNMTDGRLGSLWDKSASAGVEFSLPIIALRGGYATSLGAVNDDDLDGDAANMLTAGLSLGPVDIGAAKLSGGSFHGVPRNGWVVTAGLAFRGRTPK